jgi:hypothetical protein
MMGTVQRVKWKSLNSYFEGLNETISSDTSLFCCPFTFYSFPYGVVRERLYFLLLSFLGWYVMGALSRRTRGPVQCHCLFLQLLLNTYSYLGYFKPCQLFFAQ